MASIVEQALRKAQKDGLDLSVRKRLVSPSIFNLKKIEPHESAYLAMMEAARRDHRWPPEMPIPVLTWHRDSGKYRIMDGMMRLVAAQMAEIEAVPAFVASGETYDALEHILRNGYYGEDFVELLALMNPGVRKNLAMRDEARLAGK